VSRWNDPSSWQALVDGSACPICLRGQPLDILATLDGSWLTMHEEAPVRGYVCLVSRVHAVELHELDDSQYAAFTRDVRRVSRALSKITGAVKLNCEVHGNTVPHLHIHFYPRYKGDVFEGKPIDPRCVISSPYQPGEFSALTARLLSALAEDAA
jgi:diadenosine tetraphosphate (Ap4A) HIT family hydrolase